MYKPKSQPDLRRQQTPAGLRRVLSDKISISKLVSRSNNDKELHIPQYIEGRQHRSRETNFTIGSHSQVEDLMHQWYIRTRLLQELRQKIAKLNVAGDETSPENQEQNTSVEEEVNVGSGNIGTVAFNTPHASPDFSDIDLLPTDSDDMYNQADWITHIEKSGQVDNEDHTEPTSSAVSPGSYEELRKQFETFRESIVDIIKDASSTEVQGPVHVGSTNSYIIQKDDNGEILEELQQLVSEHNELLTKLNQNQVHGTQQFETFRESIVDIIKDALPREVHQHVQIGSNNTMNVENDDNEEILETLQQLVSEHTELFTKLHQNQDHLNEIGEKLQTCEEAIGKLDVSGGDVLSNLTKMVKSVSVNVKYAEQSLHDMGVFKTGLCKDRDTRIFNQLQELQKNVLDANALLLESYLAPNDDRRDTIV